MIAEKVLFKLWLIDIFGRMKIVAPNYTFSILIWDCNVFQVFPVLFQHHRIYWCVEKVFCIVKSMLRAVILSASISSRKHILNSRLKLQCRKVFLKMNKLWFWKEKIGLPWDTFVLFSFSLFRWLESWSLWIISGCGHINLLNPFLWRLPYDRQESSFCSPIRSHRLVKG